MSESSLQKLGKDPEKIRAMFSQVASNYDKANNILSGGIHHLWRKKLVKISAAKAGDSVLDCATGTGDLAIEFKKTVGSSGQVTGTDFCAEMLATAPKKALAQDLKIQWEQADVTKLPYPTNSFNISSISFGIRNVSDPQLALSEMARVTKPGGSVLILEFGQVNLPILSQLYSYYSLNVLPALGGWITGQGKAYKYLQESSASFPCGDEFTKIMTNSGVFSECTYWSLTGGIAYLYRGVVK